MGLEKLRPGERNSFSKVIVTAHGKAKSESGQCSLPQTTASLASQSAGLGILTSLVSVPRGPAQC